ncbi:MAG TPA: hypothetical protein PLQ13_14555 [Candidatus Krumholzibacteria bacterium]|nr:hypothetical protein [Candidatus Krumholzibacteria bacterium]
MASGARKWLVGCGIGCLMVLLAFGGIGTCGYLGIRKAKERVDRMEAGYADLQAVYGPVSDFRPWPGGAVPADRLEMFLAVRDAMAPARGKLGGNLGTLGGKGDDAGNILRKFGAGANVVPSIFTFMEARNTALADHGMGPGEYVYLYTLTYYAWLRHDPEERPEFMRDEDERSDRHGQFTWTVGRHGRDVSGDDEGASGEQPMRELHRLHLAMLENQRQDARAAGADESWLAALDAQCERLEADPYALMWTDGLPEVVTASLEPWRDRLEASWSPATNVLEWDMFNDE